MGVLWTVTNEGFAKPVTLSADPAGILEGFVYYNSVLKTWRMFNGTIFISMSGDITGVTAGDGLTGGGTVGDARATWGNGCEVSTYRKDY